MRDRLRAGLLPVLGVVLTSTIDLRAQWTVADTSGNVQVLSVSPIGTSGYLTTSDPWYRSTDAGQSWTTYTPAYSIGGLPYVGIWRGAQFRGGDTVLVWGGWDYDNGYTVGRSLDDGFSWGHVLNNTAGPILRGLRDLHFPNSSRGYAAGTNGRVFRTVDGGNTWSLVSFPNTLNLYAVHFSDPLTGVVAGDGVFKRTTDPLQGWTDVTAPAGSYRLDGQGSDILAAGPNVVLTSSDGGASWTTQPSPFPFVSRVYMIDPLHVLVIVTDQVYNSVELPAFPDERRLSAVDAHGRTVHQARYPGGPARLVELSLHHLESGAYRILLQGSDRLRSATVLISH